MRHAILGAGGVGGLVGAVLAKAGESVKLIVRSRVLGHHPQELSLESRFGSFSVPVQVVAKLDQPLEVLWITVKATDLTSSLENISSTARIGAVVPLLNGIDHVRILRDRFGYGTVVPATIAVETERIAPGTIVHRSPFARLNICSSGRSLLESTVRAFSRFGFECRFIDDESTLLWSKLVFLAPIALSTTAANRPIGQVVSDLARVEQLEAVVKEACAVATASGATVDANLVIATIKSLPPQIRSSMQKDLERGKVPELDAIAGPILRGAEAHGLEASATKELVHAIENRLGGDNRFNP